MEERKKKLLENFIRKEVRKSLKEESISKLITPEVIYELFEDRETLLSFLGDHEVQKFIADWLGKNRGWHHTIKQILSNIDPKFAAKRFIQK